MIATDEIGERIANSIVNYFESADSKLLLERLSNYGLQLQSKETSDNSNQLFMDKRFVVSGVFKQYSREGLKEKIESLGGQVASSISTKTNFLVAGEGIGPSKKAKALKLAIPIIDEEAFNQMLISKQ